MNKSEIIAEDWILESSLEPKGIWDYAQNRYYAEIKAQKGAEITGFLM